MTAAPPCHGCQAAPRRSHRVCSADQCQQGRAPCPCPQACELPADPLRDEPLSAGEAALAFVCAAAAAVIFLAILAAAA